MQSVDTLPLRPTRPLLAPQNIKVMCLPLAPATGRECGAAGVARYLPDTCLRCLIRTESPACSEPSSHCSPSKSSCSRAHFHPLLLPACLTCLRNQATHWHNPKRPRSQMRILVLSFSLWDPHVVTFLSPGFCIPICNIGRTPPAQCISRGYLIIVVDVEGPGKLQGAPEMIKMLRSVMSSFFQPG